MNPEDNYMFHSNGLCKHHTIPSICISCKLDKLEKENREMKKLIQEIALSKTKEHYPFSGGKCRCYVCQCREYLKHS
jgi:hypothetical protein